MAIVLSHKSHHASDRYPTMHHFVTEMCTRVHIPVTSWCIAGLLHCGIGATDFNVNQECTVFVIFVYYFNLSMDK